MPPEVRLRLLLRGLAKLIAIILLAGAAGTGLGIGLAALAGDESTDGSVDTSTASSTTSRQTTTNRKTNARPTATKTEPATTTSTTDSGLTTTTRTTTTARRQGASSVRLQVVSAVLHRAATPSGRRRNRARLSVHVRVANRSKRTITNATPVLLAGTRVRADRSAIDAAGSMSRPIPAASTADGTLRFETAGAVTDRLVSTRRARFRIAGKTVTRTVEIGSPVRSGDESR